MFKKIFEYAGPYKKNMYVATVVVLVSVLMGVLPFVLAYQVIAPLVMGESIEASFIISRVVLVLACLVLQALFYGWEEVLWNCSANNRLFKYIWLFQIAGWFKCHLDVSILSVTAGLLFILVLHICFLADCFPECNLRLLQFDFHFVAV